MYDLKRRMHLILRDRPPKRLSSTDRLLVLAAALVMLPFWPGLAERIAQHIKLMAASHARAEDEVSGIGGERSAQKPDATGVRAADSDGAWLSWLVLHQRPQRGLAFFVGNEERPLFFIAVPFWPCSQGDDDNPPMAGAADGGQLWLAFLPFPKPAVPTETAQP
jgi:hypothetical protein